MLLSDCSHLLPPRIGTVPDPEYFSITGDLVIFENHLVYYLFDARRPSSENNEIIYAADLNEAKDLNRITIIQICESDKIGFFIHLPSRQEYTVGEIVLTGISHKTFRKPNPNIIVFFNAHIDCSTKSFCRNSPGIDMIFSVLDIVFHDLYVEKMQAYEKYICLEQINSLNTMQLIYLVNLIKIHQVGENCEIDEQRLRNFFTVAMLLGSADNNYEPNIFDNQEQLKCICRIVSECGIELPISMLQKKFIINMAHFMSTRLKRDGIEINNKQILRHTIRIVMHYGVEDLARVDFNLLYMLVSYYGTSQLMRLPIQSLHRLGTKKTEEIEEIIRKYKIDFNMLCSLIEPDRHYNISYYAYQHVVNNLILKFQCVPDLPKAETFIKNIEHLFFHLDTSQQDWNILRLELMASLPTDYSDIFLSRVGRLWLQMTSHLYSSEEAFKRIDIVLGKFFLVILGNTHISLSQGEKDGIAIFCNRNSDIYVGSINPQLQLSYCYTATYEQRLNYYKHHFPSDLSYAMRNLCNIFAHFFKNLDLDICYANRLYLLGRCENYSELIRSLISLWGKVDHYFRSIEKNFMVITIEAECHDVIFSEEAKAALEQGGYVYILVNNQPSSERELRRYYKVTGTGRYGYDIVCDEISLKLIKEIPESHANIADYIILNLLSIQPLPPLPHCLSKNDDACVVARCSDSLTEVGEFFRPPNQKTQTTLLRSAKSALRNRNFAMLKMFMPNLDTDSIAKLYDFAQKENLDINLINEALKELENKVRHGFTF